MLLLSLSLSPVDVEIQSSPPSCKTQTMMTYIILQWAPETPSRHLCGPSLRQLQGTGLKKADKRVPTKMQTEDGMLNTVAAD